MPISHTQTNNQFPVWTTDPNVSTPGFNRYSPLPTPTDMRNRSLFGLPLKSFLTGQTVDDTALQSYIDQAVSQLEHTLDIYVTPTQFEEKHDFVREMFAYSFAYFKLNHPNVISVEAVKISFNNDTNIPAVISFPLEHVHVMPEEGVIQLVPAFGTSLSGFLLSAFSGVQYHAFQAAMLNTWPGAVRISYTCGWNEGKIPSAVSGLIERMAAYKFLSVMGPILFPVNSTSIGIDGTSQSVGTQGVAHFRQRMDELDKMINQELDAIKGYYQRKYLVDWF